MCMLSTSIRGGMYVVQSLQIINIDYKTPFPCINLLDLFLVDPGDIDPRGLTCYTSTFKCKSKYIHII